MSEGVGAWFEYLLGQSGWHGIVRFWRVFDVGPKFSVGVKIVLGRRGSKFYLDQNVHARPLSKAFFNLFFD